MGTTGVDHDGRRHQAVLTQRFRDNARSSMPRAPLNAALSSGIASRPELVRLLAEAPPEQQVPVLLLAAIHDLVLREPDHELAQWYGSVVDDPRPADDLRLMEVVRTFLDARTDLVVDLLRRRRTQTNEVGRCALFVLGMAATVLDEPTDRPFAHLDVGTSAGLNLLLDRYEYRYDPGGTIGAPSPVVIETGVRGDAPVPAELPPVAARCGIDVAPIDVTDPDAARWLEACCWPDQADRFRRLHAAIELAVEHPPELLAGDAVASVGPAIERMAPRGHPLVTTSWVLNYFSPADRTEFVAQLDRAARDVDLTWLAIESPHQTPGLPWPEELHPDHESHLLEVTWRGGRRGERVLARCHPHGYWAHWRV